MNLPSHKSTEKGSKPILWVGSRPQDLALQLHLSWTEWCAMYFMTYPSSTWNSTSHHCQFSKPWSFLLSSIKNQYGTINIYDSSFHIVHEQRRIVCMFRPGKRLTVASCRSSWLVNLHGLNISRDSWPVVAPRAIIQFAIIHLHFGSSWYRRNDSYTYWRLSCSVLYQNLCWSMCHDEERLAIQIKSIFKMNLDSMTFVVYSCAEQCTKLY
jgi:hypothetical protein